MMTNEEMDTVLAKHAKDTVYVDKTNEDRLKAELVKQSKIHQQRLDAEARIIRDTHGAYVDKTGTDQKLNPMRDVYQEFPRAMYAVAAITAFGARKHAPRGWRTFEHKYAFAYHLGKIGRHLLGLETNGEVNEADGKMLHMAQVAWNALGYLDHLLRQHPELLERLQNPVLIGSTRTDEDGITTTIIDAFENAPFARERSET